MVSTVLIVLLIFLLLIFLGLQMQITTTNRDLLRIEEQLKEIAEAIRTAQKK